MMTLPPSYISDRDERPTLLDPEKLAEIEAKQQILRELDIAHEIYLAKNWITQEFSFFNLPYME